MVKKGYMKTPYARLVEKLGEEGAKAEMSRRRGMVKNPKGLHTMSKERRIEIASMGGRASHENRAKRPVSEPEE